MRKAWAVMVVLLVAAAFAAGYWPQRERLVQAQEEANELRRQLSESRSQLAAAEAKARLGRVFGRYLALQDAVASGNYGEAQALSSPFFDAVHEERTKGPDPAARTALDAVLMWRDAVTAGIARGEGSVREVLEPIARELRRALGYPCRLSPPPPPFPRKPGPSLRLGRGHRPRAPRPPHRHWNSLLDIWLRGRVTPLTARVATTA